MATRNAVQVTLSAIDNLTPSINQAKNETRGLGVMGVAAGNLIATGITSAFQVAGNAVQALQGQMQEAARAQGDQITTASTFSAVTGKSFQESITFVRDFNKELTVMANDLPGTAQQYKVIANAISDNLVSAFKVDGKLNVEPFKETLKQISGSFGALSDASGVDAFSAADSVARLLDGQTAALRLIFFDKNPVVKNLLQEELGKQGKTINDWAALDLKQRATILESVAKRTLTDDVRKASSETFSAITGTIQSELFDAESGLFGFLRDLGGGKTVIGGISKAVSGIRDLAIESGKLLEALGIDLPDPMKLLYDGVTKFTEGVTLAANWFKDIRASLGFKDDAKGENQPQQPQQSGFKFSAMDVSSFVSNIDTSWVSDGITDLINRGVERAKSFLQGLNIDPSDFGGQIGQFVGNLQGEIINGIVGADWGAILSAVWSGTVAIIQGIAGFWGGYVGTLIPQIQEALGRVGTNITTGLNKVWDGIWQAARGWIDDRATWLSGVGDAIGAALIRIRDGIVAAITSWVPKFQVPAAPAFSTPQPSAPRPVATASPVTAIAPAVQTPAVQAANQRLPSTATASPVANSSAVQAANQRFPVLPKGKAGGFLPPSFGSGLGLPFNLNTLLGAAMDETRRMPAGASLAVANSSEAILNQRQMSGLTGLLQTAVGALGKSPFQGLELGNLGALGSLGNLASLQGLGSLGKLGNLSSLSGLGGMLQGVMQGSPQDSLKALMGLRSPSSDSRALVAAPRVAPPVRPESRQQATPTRQVAHVTNHITVNAAPGQDVKQVAKEVVAEIEQLFRTYQNERLVSG